jgi:hypothetical protein
MKEGARYDAAVTPFPFLSDEWFAEVRRIVDEQRVTVPDSADLHVNLLVTGTPFDADRRINLALQDGAADWDQGHVDDADLTLTTDYGTAREVFMTGDPQAALQGPPPAAPGLRAVSPTSPSNRSRRVGRAAPASRSAGRTRSRAGAAPGPWLRREVVDASVSSRSGEPRAPRPREKTPGTAARHAEMSRAPAGPAGQNVRTTLVPFFTCVPATGCWPSTDRPGR